MFKYLIQALFLYVQLGGSQKEYERCVDNTNAVGTCRKLVHCEAVTDDFRLNNIQPKTCSSTPNGTPIVCCRHGASHQATDTTSPESIDQQLANVYAASVNRGRRISDQKCQNYSSKVTQNIDYISLLPEPQVMSVAIAKCDYDNTALIVGGQDAELGEFPHMAALGWPLISGGYALKCGGSLISEKFVLTAGHCTKSGRDPSISSSAPTVVRLGDHNLNENVFDGASPIQVPIRRIIPHPGYRAPLRYNDIALVELADALQFSADIRPACLWSLPVPTSKAVATGWGVVNTKTQRPSEVLQKVSLDFVDVPTCTPLVKKHRHWPNGLANTQLCAGVLSGGKDTCQGDSGGPLQVVSKDNHCIFHVVGVTSFGGACAAKNQPAVYTKVSEYLDWIESVVWPRG